MLCAYLGQLARLRDALRNEVAVIIDERDQADLNDREDESDSQGAGEVVIERVNVTKRVRFFHCGPAKHESTDIVGSSSNCGQLSRRRRPSKSLIPFLFRGGV